MKLSLKSLLLITAVSSSGPSAAADFDRAMAALREGRPTEGASAFHELALSGDPDAMYNLALLYYQGVGLPQSPEEALYWAWRARLEAQENGQSLVQTLLPSVTKEQRANVYQRLTHETRDTVNFKAPLSFVKIALIEKSLAAKPSQVEIYASAAMAVALGFSPAASLRNDAAASLPSKDSAKAEQRLRELFRNWCAVQNPEPTICGSIATN